MSLSKPSQLLDSLTGLLETRSGRDKAFRIIGYAAKVVSGLLVKYRDPASTSVKKLQTLSETISNFRVTLRLFDSIPMLQYTLFYGWGGSEPDRFVRLCNVAQHILYLIFYPCEHIAWAGSLKLVDADVLKWLYRADWLWVFALLFALPCYIYQYYHAAKEEARVKRTLRKMAKEHGDADTSASALIDQLTQLRAKKKSLALNLLQDGADFMNAIHWLPPGYLWSEKLPTYVVGVFGVISSAVGVYKNWPNK